MDTLIAELKEPRVSWRTEDEPQVVEIARTILRVADALRGT